MAIFLLALGSGGSSTSTKLHNLSLYFFVYSFFRIVEENTENCRRRDQGLGQGGSNNNTSSERERIRLSNLLQSTPYIRIVNMIHILMKMNNK